jgi:hypothetical protein
MKLEAAGAPSAVSSSPAWSWSIVWRRAIRSRPTPNARGCSQHCSPSDRSGRRTSPRRLTDEDTEPRPPQPRFHLIEQPSAAVCSAGPLPVCAIATIASKSSRRAFVTGAVFEASSRPWYCSSRSAL